MRAVETLCEGKITVQVCALNDGRFVCIPKFYDVRLHRSHWEFYHTKKDALEAQKEMLVDYQREWSDGFNTSLPAVANMIAPEVTYAFV